MSGTRVVFTCTRASAKALTRKEGEDAILGWVATCKGGGRRAIKRLIG
jgi:hypothetical protein